MRLQQLREKFRASSSGGSEGGGDSVPRPYPRRAVGIAVVVAIAVSAVLVYQKERITTTLSPGETITAQFERQYKLRPFRHDVKLAGAIVGKITSDEYDQGAQMSTVTMKVDNGVLDKLGTAPSASIRPTLVLGGEYYVELRPGGGQGRFDNSQVVPVTRTSIPVELDRVLSPLDTETARSGIQTTVGELDGTLRQGGREALRGLLAGAPGTLRPAGGVLDAARGTQPDRDLTDVVTGLESTADALSSTDGRIARINAGLRDSAGALAVSSPALRSATETSVETQRITRQGLVDLQPTLRKLTETAPRFRESAQTLDPLLKRLDEVLPRTRDLTADLRKLLPELRPLVEQLQPVSEKTTEAFDDLEGPVLDRINGPIYDTVFSKFRGSGPFAGAPCCGAADNLFYEETGYLLSHLLSTFSVFDRNGAAARLSPGFGVNSLGGGAFPSFEQFLEAFGQSPRVGSRAALGGVPMPALPGAPGVAAPRLPGVPAAPAPRQPAAPAPRPNVSQPGLLGSLNGGNR